MKRFVLSAVLVVSALFALPAQAQLPSVVGCADGQREGFTNLTQYPNVAGCSGGWQIPGINQFAPASAPACPGLAPADTRAPACNRQSGDDSANPLGNGCNVADLCAPGWHVCLDTNDFRNSAGGAGCGDAVPPGQNLLFMTRQSSNGCFVCATGTSTGPECNSSSCAGNCLMTENTTNDMFGCGTKGVFVNNSACSPFNRALAGPPCNQAGSGWFCDDPGPSDNNGLCESFTLQHLVANDGGVICCRDGFASDTDGDGVGDETDNCLGVPNPPQTDSDCDGFGDACDNVVNTTGFDDDGDTVCNFQDNCVNDANTDQSDVDGDGVGDVCDNCPNVANVDQVDSDGDGTGDVCEVVDGDGDGVVDDDDNCPGAPNPDQTDSDMDGAGDACDCAPNNPLVNPGAAEVCNGQDDNCDGQVDEGLADSDGDGTCDGIDPFPGGGSGDSECASTVTVFNGPQSFELSFCLESCADADLTAAQFCRKNETSRAACSGRSCDSPNVPCGPNPEAVFSTGLTASCTEDPSRTPQCAPGLVFCGCSYNIPAGETIRCPCGCNCD